MTTATRRCDYEGSPYRVEFWEDADRAYEDAADRIALRALLPRAPGRLLEIGAGYGRLADMYGGATETFLLDYAPSMLSDAGPRVGPRHTLVCGDVYALPFATGSMDTVVMVRVLHHVEDVVAALLEISRVLRTGGSLVLEFANKRHLKAVVRHLANPAEDSPLSLSAREFVELNWNFHPAFVDAALAACGLMVRQRRATSLLRAPALKSRIPAERLARLDALVGGVVAPLAPAPSQYVRAARLVGGAPRPFAWRCPKCGNEPLRPVGTASACDRCGRRWPVKDGIYFFRSDLL